MKLLLPTSTWRERFASAFLIVVLSFYLLYCAVHLFSSEQVSNIVIGGEALYGLQLHVINFILIPCLSVLLAAVVATGVHRNKRNEK
jgi:uncharacterized membrane protein (DUF485 family)